MQKNDERPRVVAACLVIMRISDRVFMLRRKNTGFADGLFTLPSGHVEKGELPTQAAVREAMEETGVVVKKMHFQHVMNHIEENGINYVHYFFEADDWSGMPTNSEPEKCDMTRWISENDIDDSECEIIPFVKKALDYIKLGVKFSEL